MASDLDMRDAAAVAAALDEASRALRDAPNRRGCAVRLGATGRVLVTGDLHDNPVHFAKVRTLARLDESSAHHLVLHEIIHGEHLINSMDFSYRMIVRVADLVRRYPGQVHPLLANHEVAQLTGRGVSKGAGNSVELFNDALDFSFGDDAGDVAEAINRFIRAMPLALLSNSGLCCAHSLPDARLMERFGMDVLDRDLTDADYHSPAGAAYAMTWGRRYTDESVETLAERWGVRLFCLGHRHVETGIEQVGKRVIVLNTDHERATVLPIDLADVPDVEMAVMSALPLSSVGQ